jgi:hypothetical protein
LLPLPAQKPSDRELLRPPPSPPLPLLPLLPLLLLLLLPLLPPLLPLLPLLLLEPPQAPRILLPPQPHVSFAPLSAHK